MSVFNSNDVTVSIGGVLLTDHITSVDFGESVSCLVTEVPFIASGVADLATISVSWPMSGPVTTNAP